MTALTRYTGRLSLVAAAALAVAMLAAPQAAPAANAACSQALAYERTAANDQITRQASYDSAVAGLSANQRCDDAQMHLVNEAYLLSMRAPAEHELKIGNWQRDFERANMLLTQCSNWPGLRGKKPGIDCDTQRRYNLMIAKSLTLPTPAPTATPGPARPAMPLPPPPSPIPSPRS